METDLKLSSIDVDDPKTEKVDMKHILGYLNQSAWTNKLSIGSIMSLKPLKLRSVIEEGRNELQLTRDSFITKVTNLVTSYFCYSTELRFLLHFNEMED